MEDEIRDWLAWSHKLNTAHLEIREDYRALALKLSDSELAQMGEFYKRAVRENSIRIIGQWLAYHRGETPMSQEESGVRNLLYFWRLLSNQACAPFSKGPVLELGPECMPIPDWSKVPREMQSLGEAAELSSKFRYSGLPEEAEEISSALGPEDRHIFEKAAETVRNLDYKNIRRWSSPRVNYHVEAYLLSRLIRVLDGLGLPYYTR